MVKELGKLTAIEIEILRRSTRNEDDDVFVYTLDWLASGVTPVKTRTAFELARGGREVWQIYADGTDSLLDCIEEESEHYPDKAQSYPDIETIFVVEGEL